MKHILIVQPYLQHRNYFRILNKRQDFDDTRDNTDVLYWIEHHSGKYYNRNFAFNFKRILKYV